MRHAVRRRYAVALAFLAGPLHAVSARANDQAFGQYLSSECVTCHRADGTDKGIPSIVGWPSDQFIAVLKSYKAKDRDNVVMQTIAGKFSDAEMAALAAYYANLGKPKK